MATDTTSPLLKSLASSDPDTRSEALTSLRAYLTRSAPFTSSDLLKLHKYLYFAVYMSDGPAAQHSLCQSLASLVAPLPQTGKAESTLAEENVVPFLAAFWTTMSREWVKIDRLRMDKYLLLIRLMLRAMFAYLKRGKWEEERVEALMQTARDGPLRLEEDRTVSRGLTYHVIDCWIDEIEAVAGQELDDENERDELPVEALLQPVRRIHEKSSNKTLRRRAGDALDDERLADWGFRQRDDEEAGESD